MPVPQLAKSVYSAALRQLRARLLPVLDALPAGRPRLLIEPTRPVADRRSHLLCSLMPALATAAA